MRKNLFKLIIVLSLLLSAILVAGSINIAKASTLILNPPFADIEAGKDLTVEVVVNGQDELVDGVDANVGYDVNFLKVKEMKKGEFFTEYPVFKDDNGLVKITALGAKEGTKIFGDIVVATLVFEVLDSGDTKLTIAYEEGATSESNVAEHATAKDLLTSVTDGSYNVVASPEKLQEARIKKARQSGLIPVLVFVVLIVIVGLGIWYYRKKKKPEEDYFVPEEFPMDQVPKSDETSKDPVPPQV